MLRLRFLLPLLLPLLGSGCLQVAYTLGGKEIAPEVRAAAKETGAWYAYLSARDPGFCLITRYAVVWHDPQLHLGYWRGHHPQAPHRVLMEARDTEFILHRRYVWDGMTWGRTETADLLPTLLHDALYHALQAGAPFPRREADRAYLRARRAAGGRRTWGEYAAIRLMGGLFNRFGAADSLFIEPIAPETPRAALEPYRPEPLAGEEETPAPGTRGRRFRKQRVTPGVTCRKD